MKRRIRNVLLVFGICAGMVAFDAYISASADTGYFISLREYPAAVAQELKDFFR